MYRKNPVTSTSIRTNKSYAGERIEEKINRIVNNKEPITDGAPLVYTDRKEGVVAATDIRTDRFEIAVEAMDKSAQAHIAKREEFHKKLEDANKSEKKEVGGEKTGETSSKGGENAGGKSQEGKP